jgi:murein DD-endopeptidase MepM/ murein hydrolase activator NlpD
VPPLSAKPRHARPREVPAARAVLVPVVLMGTSTTALGGLALSASATEHAAPVTAAAASVNADAVTLLDERAEQAEQRVSRERVRVASEAQRLAAEQAAAEQSAAETARVAAERAAAEAARVAAEHAAADKAAAEKAATGQWARPALGRLTSTYGPRWGRMHKGIDLAAGTGSPIRAAAAGTVVSAGDEGGYGYAVRIRHADGTQTLYAHNSRLLVRAGQQVSAGEQIAREGNSGNSTGPHLHFEVVVGGRNVNPLTWLRERGVAV